MRGYQRFQRLGLENPGMTLFLSFCLLIAMGMLYAKFGKGDRVLPRGRPGAGVRQHPRPPGHEYP